MGRARHLLTGLMLLTLAACAGGPAPAPAPQSPPRDYLVELGDAEAVGNTDAAMTIAREYLSDPARGEADARRDVAEFLAEHGAPLAALEELTRQADALAAEDPVNHAALIDLKARMAELAVDANDNDRAAREVGGALYLVRTHLGADHPRLAPLLGFARTHNLDMAILADLSGIDDLDQILAKSIARARESDVGAPTARSMRRLDLPFQEPDFDLVKVFYGTNRAPETKRSFLTVEADPVLDARTYYGGDRAPLETGSVMVSVPHNRSVGDIPKPNIMRFEFRPDPSRHVILGDMQIHAGLQEFALEMKDELARTRRGEVFVYVHGYNNDFATAVERTAQLGVDLEIDGASVLYSWPSAGNVFSYKADREEVTTESVRDLETFLTVIAQETGAKRVHVIAHSMGNEFLVRALAGLAERTPDTLLLDQVVFASPDVDADEFISLVSGMEGLAQDITLYASSKDLALQASRRFNRTGRRAGESDVPIILSGLNTVDTTMGSSGTLGHSDIFGSAFTDFQAILWLSLEPEQRCVLGKRTINQAIAWVFGTPRQDFCGEEEFMIAVTTLRRVGPERSLVLLGEKARETAESGDPSADLWGSALKVVETLQ